MELVHAQTELASATISVTEAAQSFSAGEALARKLDRPGLRVSQAKLKFSGRLRETIAAGGAPGGSSSTEFEAL